LALTRVQGEAMEAHVEKSKEDPIPTRKLLMMVNDYVVNSCRFVNRFHAVCEEKLHTVSTKITQTEIMLSILEAKINSVEYVANMTTTAGTAAAASDVVPDVAAAPTEGQSAGQPAAQQPSQQPAAPAEAAPPPAPAAAAGPRMYMFKDHPSFKKYFYLLSIGIPKAALAQQMRVNDLDPAYLEREPEELTDTPMPDENEEEEEA